MPKIDWSTAERIVRKNKGKERLPLHAVRNAFGKTQSDIARALDIDQGEVSRIERRPDVLLSTLRKYAAALGGHCELAFVFEDGRRALIALPEPDEAGPK
jgi:transcriptional regulator with XRE-family HTH domain